MTNGGSLTATQELEWLAGHGARFALVNHGDKKPVGRGWQNQPRTLDEATAHAADGGNVGLLLGAPSGGIVALDLDHDFQGDSVTLGSLAHTVKVVRSNAPARGKLLYRVRGELPPSRAWKPGAQDGHPRAELLSSGRHALIPPSCFADGAYRLADADLGLLTIDPETLDRMWWLLTGEGLTRTGRRTREETGEFITAVKDAWPTEDVFTRFARNGGGKGIESNGDTRLLGNGGLLINDWRWYCHADGVGGDQIDAWYYCAQGRALDHGDGRAFMDTVHAMALAGGIPIPVHTNGTGDHTDAADGASPPQGDKGSDAARKPGQAEILYSLASDHAEIFTAQDGTAHAFVPVAGRRECYRLTDANFAGWLTALYRARCGGAMPGADGRKEAIAALSWDARATRRDVFVRVGGYAGKVFIDLGTEEWDAIVVDEDGWQIVKNPSIAFRRPASMRPLPTPLRGYDMAQLRPFLNLEPEQWPLVAAWLIAATSPSGPYPILAFVGEQGSAKSAMVRVLKGLLDPAAAGLRGQPEEVRDLWVGANNSWVLAYDNVSHLNNDVSDALCRLATGGGYAKRANYTDDGEFVMDAQRPVVINGIGEVVTRPDLMDRTILIAPPTIPEDKRRNEKEFWRAFDAARPYLLGALLDALSVALARIGGVQLDALPRMADFAMLAAAAEPAYRADIGFLEAYAENREEAHATVIESSTLGEHLRKLVLVNGAWEGTAAELLTALNERASENEQRSRAWPKAPNKLPGALQRIAPSLRHIGVDVTLLPRQKDGRRLRLTRLNG